MKIANNFLLVSKYNNDISWIKDFTDNYIVYDRSDTTDQNISIDNKVIHSKNIGYNLYDYFTYIIDNYDNLPDCVIFVKGNVFPRHVTKEFFEGIMNNDHFTPIEDPKMHKVKWPVSLFSSDGGYCEINNSWYTKHFETKYFNNYNDFIKFCFINPVIPRYVRFAPGANYIVPKENILKLPKQFYENLRFFISYTQLPGEAHIIERALYTFWTSNFEISDDMKKPIPAEFTKLRKRNIFTLFKEIINKIKIYIQ
jgi:hypothetical protein